MAGETRRAFGTFFLAVGILGGYYQVTKDCAVYEQAIARESLIDKEVIKRANRQMQEERDILNYFWSANFIGLGSGLVQKRRDE